ncbi:hypothetical protein JCM6882_000774 [Rhodosporidiobolus microsporus]
MTTPPQECWVCGKATTTRCGPCGAAGVDIFFCSRDHQKRVWPMHKLVCGPGKASPFVWPHLSQKESDYACDRLWELIPSEPLAGLDIGSLLWKFVELKPEEIVPFIKMHTVGGDNSAFPWWDARDSDTVFTLIRTAIHSFGSFKLLDPTCAEPCAPLSFAHDLWMQALCGVKLGDTRYTPWITVFLHRLLLFCTLMSTPTAPGPTTPISEAWDVVTHTYEVLCSLAEEKDAPVDPKFARQFKKVVSEDYELVRAIHLSGAAWA